MPFWINRLASPTLLNTTEAGKLMRKLLKRHGFASTVAATDKLRSYSTAFRDSTRLIDQYSASLYTAYSRVMANCDSVEFHMPHKWLFDLTPKGTFIVHNSCVRPLPALASGSSSPRK